MNKATIKPAHLFTANALARAGGLGALLAAGRGSTAGPGATSPADIRFARHTEQAQGVALPECAAPAGPHPMPAQLLSLSSPGPNWFDVSFRLTESVDVQLDLVDSRGHKVLGIVRRGLRAPAEHRITLTLEGLGLPAGNYQYRLRVFGSESGTASALPFALVAGEMQPCEPEPGRALPTLMLRGPGAGPAPLPHRASA